MVEQKSIKNAIKTKFPIINIDANLEATLQAMKANDVSVLAVKIGKELIGLVTIADVVYSLANGQDLHNTKVSSFMTKCEFNTSEETRNPCIQLDENEDAFSAIKVLHEAGVNHLLVSGEDGKAVGIVSSFELAKLMVD